MNRYPRFRKSSWFNKTTMQEMFGIQVKITSDQPWQHMSENAHPCIYDSSDIRDAKLQEFLEQSKKGNMNLKEIYATIHQEEQA